MHKADLVMDFQFGSTGKGLIAGYLARRNPYDSVVCSFATNAGHTYINAVEGIHMMTQQLPTGICSPTVKNVFIGPGAAIDGNVLLSELTRYADLMKGKRLLIHPHAAVVTHAHAEFEKQDGRTKMGSTAKGVGEAYIERIRRGPDANVAKNRFEGTELAQFVVTVAEYEHEIEKSELILIEGAQGFSLSMYHGFYPFTTSRDVTPWQICADCGIPFRWASYVSVIGTLRVFPIRVNNRDGSSGPGYPDQVEISWDQVGVNPELTTVTKLPRRLFTFSYEQLRHAMRHCGGYWETRLFLNFANYLGDVDQLEAMVHEIERPTPDVLNAPKVEWVGFGADDSQVVVCTDEFINRKPR